MRKYLMMFLVGVSMLAVGVTATTKTLAADTPLPPAEWACTDTDRSGEIQTCWHRPTGCAFAVTDGAGAGAPAQILMANGRPWCPRSVSR